MYYLGVIDLKVIFSKIEEFSVIVIVLLVSWVLAAHYDVQNAPFGVVGCYIYWTCRIAIEAVFFITTLLLVEKHFKQLIPDCVNCLLAILISLVPFVLAITMLDLIIGFPELGFNGDTEMLPDEKARAFGLEVLYLLDNHLFLSILLLMPRLLLTASNKQLENNKPIDVEPVTDKTPDISQLADNMSHTFLDSLTPQLDGHICSMEAQEHYILVTTTEESRMVLHRFSDAIHQTPATLGMRVHRSHWVAHSAVQEIVVEGQSMKLKLTDERLIPVSRTFRAAVEGRYSTTL